MAKFNVFPRQKAQNKCQASMGFAFTIMLVVLLGAYIVYAIVEISDFEDSDSTVS